MCMKVFTFDFGASSFFKYFTDKERKKWQSLHLSELEVSALQGH